MFDDEISDDLKITVWRNENKSNIGFDDERQAYFPYRILGQNKMCWAVGPGIKLDKNGILHDDADEYPAKDGIPEDIIKRVFLKTLKRSREGARRCVDYHCGAGTFDKLPRDRRDIMIERAYELGSCLFFKHQVYIYALVSGDLKRCLDEGKVYYRSPGSNIPRVSSRSLLYAEAEKKALARDPRDYSYSARALRTMSVTSAATTNYSHSKIRKSLRLPPRGSSRCSSNAGGSLLPPKRLPARVRISGSGMVVRADSVCSQLLGRSITFWDHAQANKSTLNVLPSSETEGAIQVDAQKSSQSDRKEYQKVPMVELEEESEESKFNDEGDEHEEKDTEDCGVANGASPHSNHNSTPFDSLWRKSASVFMEI